jgi:hypothetical protein
MREDIACESQVELEFCTRLDGLKEVLHLFEQPPPLHYRYQGTTRPYHPDFLFSYTDGRNVLVEVKTGRDVLVFKNIAKWDGLATYCERKGFGFYIGDARDSVYRLLHTPIPVQLLASLAAAVARGPIGWSDAQAIRDSCGAANRLLVAALLRGSFVVGQDFTIRAAVGDEHVVAERFRSWMADVNELPTTGRLAEVKPVTQADRKMDKRYPNSFKRWTANEEDDLVDGFYDSRDLAIVAENLGRSPKAVRLRLEALGILAPAERTGTR